VGQPQVVEIDNNGLIWVKSSTSANGTNEDCLELAGTGHTVLVRDSRDRSGPRLSYPLASWKVLLTRL
jgi:hypothetical protein